MLALQPSIYDTVRWSLLLGVVISASASSTAVLISSNPLELRSLPDVDLLIGANVRIFLLDPEFWAVVGLLLINGGIFPTDDGRCSEGLKPLVLTGRAGCAGYGYALLPLEWMLFVAKPGRCFRLSILEVLSSVFLVE
jgi:hypothetical protein